jgi:hypothetical protein
MDDRIPLLPDAGPLHDAVARNEERIRELRRKLAEMDRLLERLEGQPAGAMPFDPVPTGSREEGAGEARPDPRPRPAER